MEAGPAAVVYHHPAHPYAQALLQSARVPNPSCSGPRARAAERT